jgi:hypothetical protein
MIPILAAIVFAASPGNAAPSMTAATSRVVGFVPKDSGLGLHRTLAVNIVGRSFDKITEGGGVSLQFNPLLVRVVSVTVDANTWEFFTQNGTINNTAGRVDDILFASFAGRSGDFPIATVNFETLALGTTQLSLTESALNPFASGGQPLPVTFQPGSISSGRTVPIPKSTAVASALALLLAGWVLSRRAQRHLAEESR